MKRAASKERTENPSEKEEGESVDSTVTNVTKREIRARGQDSGARSYWKHSRVR